MKAFTGGIAAALLGLTCVGAQAEPVSFVTIGHSYYSAALFVAEREGIFKKYGLEPQVTVVGGGPLALQAVLSGNADVGVLSYEHVLTAAANGRKMVAVFNMVSRPTSNIIASNPMVSAAKGKSLADKIKDLKGKRIGVPAQGGSGDKLARALLAEQGIKASDVDMVYSGASTGSYVAALQRNLIDAAIVPEPAGLQTTEKGVGGVYLDLLGGEVPAFKDMIYMSLTTTPQMIAKKPELVRKVVAAFAEAHKVIKENPERAISDMKAEYPDMTDAMNRELFKMLNEGWSRDGNMSLAQAKATFAYLQPEGDHPINFPETFTNEFLPK